MIAASKNLKHVAYKSLLSRIEVRAAAQEISRNWSREERLTRMILARRSQERLLSSLLNKAA